MELVLARNKETKGAVRYGDADGHNLYFKKEEAGTLGNPRHILVTVQPMSEEVIKEV